MQSDVRFPLLLLGAWVMALASPTAAGAQPADEFYRHASLRFHLSSEPGGGFDIIARTFAKYLSRQLPGNPTIAVVNMPGGGGTILANWCYNIAPRDGSVICMPLSTMPLNQVIAPEPVRYDASRVSWIGNLERATGTILTWHTSPTRSIEDAIRRETPMAGTGKNSIIYQLLSLSNHIIGTRFKIVLGYSTGRVLAIERGEVDGTASTLQNIPAMAPSWTEAQYNLLAINAPKRIARYPAVPTMIEYAKTERHRQMLEFWMAQSATARAIFAPPEVPADRIEVLRRAFDRTAKDPAFVAEVAKLQTLIEPDSGEEVQSEVRRLLGTSPEVAAAIVDVLK